MTNAPTLLLPPRSNDDTRGMKNAATRAGWQTVAAPDYRVPAGFLPAGTPAGVYGDPLFCDLAALALSLALLEPPDDWLPALPHEWRKRNVSLTTLGAARTLTEPSFVKPAADKSFPARVYRAAAELAAVLTDLPADLPVLVSEPVVWDVEYRVFVLRGEIATASSYFRGGELVYTETHRSWDAPPDERADALAFAETVLGAAGDTLPPGVVLDVGFVAGRGWAVVEANPAWASGLYGCDPDDALRTVAASVRLRAALTPAEVRFARAAITIES